MYYEFSTVFNRDELDAITGLLGGFLFVKDRDHEDPLISALEKLFNIAMSYHTPNERKELRQLFNVVQKNFTKDSLDKDLFRMGLEGITRSTLDDMDKKNM